MVAIKLFRNINLTLTLFHKMVKAQAPKWRSLHSLLLVALNIIQYFTKKE